jgi:hypothetical protein
MIEYHGVFQLVKVIKEDKTGKGDTAVYFTAATKRFDKDTDFKFFKVFGQQADFMIRNLIKGNDGKYQSRKMYLTGYVETYTENQDVVCEADIETSAIPPNIGLLKQNITVKCKTIIKVPKDVYRVSHLEFVDRPKDNALEIIVNNGISHADDSVVSATGSAGASAAKANTSQANKEINDALKEFKDVDLSEFNGGTLEDQC